MSENTENNRTEETAPIDNIDPSEMMDAAAGRSRRRRSGALKRPAPAPVNPSSPEADEAPQKAEETVVADAPQKVAAAQTAEQEQSVEEKPKSDNTVVQLPGIKWKNIETNGTDAMSPSEATDIEIPDTPLEDLEFPTLQLPKDLLGGEDQLKVATKEEATPPAQPTAPSSASAAETPQVADTLPETQEAATKAAVPETHENQEIDQAIVEFMARIEKWKAESGRKATKPSSSIKLTQLMKKFSGGTVYMFRKAKQLNFMPYLAGAMKAGAAAITATAVLGINASTFETAKDRAANLVPSPVLATMDAALTTVANGGAWTMEVLDSVEDGIRSAALNTALHISGADINADELDVVLGKLEIQQKEVAELSADAAPRQ